jgi:hypothetical protein
LRADLRVCSFFSGETVLAGEQHGFVIVSSGQATFIGDKIPLSTSNSGEADFAGVEDP